MTVSQLAQLLNAEPKWVLNAMAVLGGTRKYTLAMGRRLAVTRAIQAATGGPLVRCFEQAQRVLRSYKGGAAPVFIPTDTADVQLSVDVNRILSSFDVRLSVLKTTYAPRQRGRVSASRRDPLQAAVEWGTDLTLLADNLGKTVEERVRQLDSMAAFARGVHRVTAPAR